MQLPLEGYQPPRDPTRPLNPPLPRRASEPATLRRRIRPKPAPCTVKKLDDIALQHLPSAPTPYESGSVSAPVSPKILQRQCNSVPYSTRKLDEVFIQYIPPSAIGSPLSPKSKQFHPPQEIPPLNLPESVLFSAPFASVPLKAAPNSLLEQADIYMLNNENQHALFCIDKYLMTYKDPHPSAFWFKADLLIKMEMYKQASEFLDQIIPFHPDSNLFLIRAFLNAICLKFDEALQDIASVIELNPRISPEEQDVCQFIISKKKRHDEIMTSFSFRKVAEPVDQENLDKKEWESIEKLFGQIFQSVSNDSISELS